MPPEEQTAVLPAQDDGVETPSPEASPSAQAPVEPQPAAVNTPVESISNQPQEQEQPRRKPSDFYRERQRLRNMEETIALQNKKYEELAALLKAKETGVPQDVEFDPKLFSPDHTRILLAREQKLVNEINSLK